MKSLRECSWTDPWRVDTQTVGLEEEPTEPKRAWSVKWVRTKEEWYPKLQTGGRKEFQISGRDQLCPMMLLMGRAKWGLGTDRGV